MVIYSEATNASFDRKEGDTYIYNAVFDTDWRVGNVTHGGYLLGIVIKAVERYNAEFDPQHPDVSYISSHFINSSLAGPASVHITNIVKSKRWATHGLKVYQGDSLKVNAQVITSRLPDYRYEPHPIEPVAGINVLPTTTSIFAPECQIPTMFDEADYNNVIPGPEIFRFGQHIKWKTVKKEDQEARKNQAKATGGRVKLDWWAWVEFTGESKIGTDVLPFMTDIYTNATNSFDDHEKPPSVWLPTLALTLELKARLPIENDLYRGNVFGVYASMGQIHDGRYSISAEVYSSPKDSKVPPRLLATATQAALMVPFEVNNKKVKSNI